MSISYDDNHYTTYTTNSLSFFINFAQSAGAVEYTICTPPNECPGYDIKQSDGEVLVMLELWGMRSTPSLPSLPGPLCSGLVASDKGPIYGLNRTKPWFEFTLFCI